MSRLDWHPRYHRAFLEGVRVLTPEERGCYTTILDLIYDRGGPVPDDARWLAGWMNCSVRKWQTIRASLVAAGKIIAEGEGQDAVLRNSRADFELDSQSARRRVNVENGSKGGRKKSIYPPKDNGINDNAEPTASVSLKLETETETKSSEDKSSGVFHAVVDHDAEAWRQAVTLLSGQGGMTPAKARPFFGRLISTHRLEPRDLLPSLAKATVTGTQDPQGYLTRAAEAVSKRRVEASKPKRVAWV